MSEKDLNDSNLKSTSSADLNAELEKLREREKELLEKSLREREEILKLKEESLREREKYFELQSSIKNKGGASDPFSINIDSKSDSNFGEASKGASPFSFNIQVDRKRRRRDSEDDNTINDKKESYKIEDKPSREFAENEDKPLTPKNDVLKDKKVIDKSSEKSVLTDKKDKSADISDNERAGKTISNEQNTKSRVVEDFVEEPIDSKIVEEPIDSKIVEEPIDSKIVEEPIDSKIVEEPIHSKIVEEPIDSKIVEEPIAKHYEEVIDDTESLKSDVVGKVERVDPKLIEAIKKDIVVPKPSDDKKETEELPNKSYSELFQEKIDTSNVVEEISPIEKSNESEIKRDFAPKSFSDLIKQGITSKSQENPTQPKQQPITLPEKAKAKVDTNKKEYVPIVIRNKRTAAKLSGAKEEEYFDDTPEVVSVKSKKDKKKVKFTTSVWRVSLLSLGVVVAFFGILFSVLFIIFGKPTDVDFVKYELVLPSFVESTFKDGDKIDLSGSYLNYIYSDGSVEKIELDNSNLASPGPNADYTISNGYVIINNWGNSATKNITVNVVYKDTKASFNLVVNKNVLSNLILINGGYRVEYGMPLPDMEIFGKYVGIESKFKKLNNTNYRFAIVIDNTSNPIDYNVNRINLSGNYADYEYEDNDKLINNIMPTYEELKEKNWWLVARAFEDGEVLKYEGEIIQIVVATNIKYYQTHGIEYTAGTTIEYIGGNQVEIIYGTDVSFEMPLPEINLNNYINGLDDYTYDDFIEDSGDIGEIKEHITYVNEVFNNGFGGSFTINAGSSGVVSLTVEGFVLVDKLIINNNANDSLVATGDELTNTNYKLILAKYRIYESYGQENEKSTERHFVVGIRV